MCLLINTLNGIYLKRNNTKTMEVGILIYRGVEFYPHVNLH